jgi:predicted helicase
MTPQQKGKIFENDIHNFIINTKKLVLREIDIKREFGTNISGIDHLIICDNYCICLQDKLQQTTITNSQVGHFITCVNNLSRKLNKRCIGIFISNNNFSSHAEKQIFDENSANMINKFDIIYDQNFDNLCRKIMLFLYEKHIWLYEPNGDCMMIL